MQSHDAPLPATAEDLRLTLATTIANREALVIKPQPSGHWSAMQWRTERAVVRVVLRALRVVVAGVHLFPAAKHLPEWAASGAWSEAWKGWGAALTVLLLASPHAVRARAMAFVVRRKLIAFAAASLVLVHLVPASDHVPRVLAAYSWADAWRALGSVLAATAFAVIAWRAARARRAPIGRLSFAFAALLAGCAASARDTAMSPGDGGAANDAAAALAPLGDGGALGSDDGASGEAPGAVLLYAHTDTTLYSFDPTNMAAKPKALGTFDCVGKTGEPPAITDIGVTKDGKLFGVSQIAAYPLELQSGKVHCAATWPLPSNANFYGLTVAPESTLDASEVILAANSAGELYRIDANSGATTQVGTLGVDPGSGLPWSLSGDIVLLANGGAPIGFATVRTCPNGQCSSVDTLIEIDPKAIKPGKLSVLKTVRGEVVRGSWCTNSSSPSTFGSMFGIAAFADRVYGFSRKGDVVEIDNTDGTGCLVAAYTTEHFAGAGVTTTAPVKAPPPK